MPLLLRSREEPLVTSQGPDAYFNVNWFHWFIRGVDGPVSNKDRRLLWAVAVWMIFRFGLLQAALQFCVTLTGMRTSTSFRVIHFRVVDESSSLEAKLKGVREAGQVKCSEHIKQNQSEGGVVHKRLLSTFDRHANPLLRKRRFTELKKMMDKFQTAHWAVFRNTYLVFLVINGTIIADSRSEGTTEDSTQR